MEPSPGARYDAIADYYDDRFGDEVGDAVISTLLDLGGPVAGKKVLDLACGQGRVTRELARRGAHLVVGLDISARLVAFAKKREADHRLGVRYLVADATSADTLCDEKAPFDTVICNMALTDIDDLKGVLDTVARVTAVGGTFAFSILHPCFPGVPGALGSWNPVCGYRVDGRWSTGGIGIRGKVGSHHRSLATIFNALVDQGLPPIRIVEPPWSMESDRPELDVPGFFVARAIRAA